MSNNNLELFLLSKIKIPPKITKQYFEKMERFSLGDHWKLCFQDLTNHDLSEITFEVLEELAFNSKTRFPTELLYRMNPSSIMELGKNPGMNIREIHKSGITGKGIKIAVIDRPINYKHIEFDGRITYIEVAPNSRGSDMIDFHGVVCASFISGKTLGVAPDSELIYYAVPSCWNSIIEYYKHQLTALRMIYEYNKNNEDKIRLVSISAPFYESQMKKRAELLKILEEQNCYVIDAINFRDHFQGLNKISIKDDNNVDNYVLDRCQKDEIQKCTNLLDRILIPSSKRTSACFSENNQYMYHGQGVSESWTIPHLVGIFALSLQAKPDITYDQFIKLVKETAVVNNYELNVINPIGIINELIEH